MTLLTLDVMLELTAWAIFDHDFTRGGHIYSFYGGRGIFYSYYDLFSHRGGLLDRGDILHYILDVEDYFMDI